MKLKPTIKDLSEVDEKYRDLYVETDGGYVLEVEGMVDRAKVAEFRDNNIKLQKDLTDTQEKLTALSAKFEGIDPEKIKELQETEAKLRDKQLIDAGRVDELIDMKLAEQRKNFQKDLAQRDETIGNLTKERDESRGTVKRLHVEKVVGDAALKHGVREGALDDVFNHAHAYGFDLAEDGNDVVIKGPSGDPRRSLSDPSKTMSVEEYFNDVLAESKPFYFKESAGGGSKGGGGGPAGRRVSLSDSGAINANIEGIASGKVQVSDN